MSTLIMKDHAERSRKEWLKKISRRGRELWPTNTYCRRQWTRQTKELIDSGRHALLTGGYSIQNQKEAAHE